MISQQTKDNLKQYLEDPAEPWFVIVSASQSDFLGLVLNYRKSLDANEMLFTVQCRRMMTTECAIQEIAASIQVPQPYWGWEALDDDLSDLGWFNARSYTIALCDSHLLWKSEEESEGTLAQYVLKTFSYASEFWALKCAPNYYGVNEVDPRPLPFKTLLHVEPEYESVVLQTFNDLGYSNIVLGIEYSGENEDGEYVYNISER